METTKLLNKNYIVLCCAAFFSNIAFSSYLLFEQWYIIDYLKKPQFVGYLLASATLPRALVMVFGGAFSDKYSNTFMLKLSLSIRFAILILCLVSLQIQALNLPLLFFFAVCFGLLDSIFQPAINSIMPKILSEQILQKANGYFLSTVQISLLLGPVVTGLSIEYFGYGYLLAEISSALFVALALIFFMRLIEPKELDKKVDVSLKKKINLGLSIVFQDVQLRWIVIFIAAINIFYFGPLIVGLPILIKSQFDGGADFVGYTQGSYAAGMIIGSIIASYFSFDLNLKQLGKFSILLGTGLALISVQGVQFLLMLNVFLLGLLSAAVNVSVFSKIQSEVDNELVGTVIGFVSSLSSGLVPISYMLAGVIIGIGVSPGIMYLFSGIIIIIFMPLIKFVELQNKDAKIIKP